MSKKYKLTVALLVTYPVQPSYVMLRRQFRLLMRIRPSKKDAERILREFLEANPCLRDNPAVTIEIERIEA